MNTKLLIGAVAVCAALVSFTPATFAAPPSFQFGLTLGDPPPPPPPDYGDDDCMSTKEILSDLADNGYSRFRNFRDGDGDFFWIDARRGTRLYRLTVDSCDGEILNRKRLFQ